MLIGSEIVLGIFLLSVLIFFHTPLLLSSIILLAYLFCLTIFHGLTLSLGLVIGCSLVVILFLNIPWLRRRLFTAKIFYWVKRKLPSISKTEQVVLQAGEVGWEKDLLIGKPNWRQFLKFPAARLTEEEQAFLDNQVNTLCSLLKDWEVINEADLPQVAWDYIKRERFLGLSLPKEYGGHGFSAFAHSTIVMKIASRSYSAAVDMMVPNSVGLAEFILHYGTDEQKKYYLPRFAVGDEIPCFALTAPLAGSDASSMCDQGIVTYGQWQGQKTLGIRLNWDKRYITLAPIATMIGLAFKLYDPDHLLGEQVDIGITLAMVPKNTPGVTIGNRHAPLMMGFLNGPIRGQDVFIPIDLLIGGQEARGTGWLMMMECLAVGRGLSLPALSTAAAKIAYRMTSAYVKVREQFHTSIGYFEGIKEALARIGGFTYLCEATRCLTAAAIDQELKPSIATAITKYHLTEMSRKVINDAMDIHGGRAIQLGPRNYLGLYYIAQPISITVEGANILTRNLIIFGQGALRCHPYIQQEISALQEKEFAKGLKKFDRLFFKHIGFTLSNLMRCLVYGLTKARWIKAPVKDETAVYFRKLTFMSVALAVVTDMSMGILGGKLKQRERLSARLGDVLSYLYLASSALKYYHDHQKPAADLPFIVWTEQYCLYQIANAFEHFFANFPKMSIVRLVKFLIFPWGNHNYLPLDKHDHQIADLMMQQNSLRERLTNHIYLGQADDICQKLDQAFRLRLQAEPAYQKLQVAIKQGIILDTTFEQNVRAAKNANILNDQEEIQLLELNRLQLEVIQVDEFNTLARNKVYDPEEAIT
jgi:acyl-CoA dehydrogenase